MPDTLPRPRRSQEERSTATRQRLIDAAVAAIAELGYAETSTNVIADRAAVTRGALQYHFASREELMLAVIDEVAAELNVRFPVDEAMGQPLAVRVDAVLDHYWAVYTSPKFRAALNIGLAAAGDPTLSQHMRAELLRLQREMERPWYELFRDLALPEAELARIRRIAMAATRGYATSLMLGAAERWAGDRRLLGSLLVAALGGEAKESEA